MKITLWYRGEKRAREGEELFAEKGWHGVKLGNKLIFEFDDARHSHVFLDHAVFDLAQDDSVRDLRSVTVEP